MAQTIVLALAIYFGIGLIFALFFVVLLAGRLDHAARGASLFFRPMIFLGCVAVWPLLLIRSLSLRTINKPIEEETS